MAAEAAAIAAIAQLTDRVIDVFTRDKSWSNLEWAIVLGLLLHGFLLICLIANASFYFTLLIARKSAQSV